MAFRFYQSFLLGLLFAALILTSGGGGGAVTGVMGESLRCFGLCTATCNDDCIAKGFKNGFCIQQGSLNQCCCL